MNAFEYALGLFSVMVGLALSDIAMSAHRIVRNFRTVRWDARVVASSLLVVVVIVRMWFAFWTIRDEGLVLVFPFYLTLFIELMILFMLAASCLPDDPPADCDLGAFYEANQRTLWTIFAAFQLSFFLHWLYFGGLGASPSGWARVLAPLAIYLTLAFVRDRRLHLTVPPALIGWEVFIAWDRALGERLS